MEGAWLREQEVGVGLGGSRVKEGGWQVGMWQACLPHALSLQELSKREVVAVGHLEVPAELAGLLQAVAGGSAPGGGRAQADQSRHRIPSSLHRPQAGPGASGGPCADSSAPG